MKKSLSILLAIAMVFTMFAGVAFADTASDKAMLVNAGVIVGNLAGDTMDDDTWTRQNLTVILSRLFGVEEEAEDTEKDHTFADVTDAYYDGFITWAKNEELMQGHSDVRFGYGEEMNVQQLATVLVRALNGGITEGDFETAVEVAIAAGILPAGTEGTDILTRGETYSPIVAALNTEVDGVKLGTSLGLVGWEVTEIAVSSVEATNLKSFTVNFNQAIDTDTADKITVTDKSVKRTVTNDDKSVIVVFDTAISQSASFELKINGVTSADGSTEVTDYEQKFTVNDVTVPVLNAATVLNHKQIELFFSEPVKFTNEVFTVLDGVKINGNAIIGTTTEYAATNSVIIEVPSLLANGTHTLAVSGIEDYAGFKIADFETSIVVVEDTAAPIATEIEIKNVNSIEISFDEKLTAIGSFEVNNNGVSAAFVADSNDTKVLLTGFTLNLGAVVEVTVKYKGQKDIVGNEVKEWTSITTKVEDDTTLPTASISVEATNKVKVTFSKSMLTGVGKISVLNKDGNVHKAEFDVNGAGTWTENNSILELTGATLGLNDVDPAEFTLVIKGMKDATVRANLLPDQNLKFNAVDTKRPTVVGQYLITEGTGTNPETKDTVTIFFSEAMDKDTITNLSNYSYNGNPVFSTVSGAKASASGDGKTVVITHNNARNFVNDITVQAVKDVAGNMLDPITTTVSKHNASFVEIDGIKATSKNKVEVTFDQPISIADPSAFRIQTGPNVTATFTSAAISADGLKVTFTTSSDLPNDPTALSLVVHNVNNLVDKYGKKLDEVNGASVGTIGDGIAPTATVASAVYGNNGVTVTIELSENLDLPDGGDLSGDERANFVITADGIVKSGGVISYSDADGDDKAKLVFEFAGTSSLVGKNVVVNYFGEATGVALVDLASPGNELKNFSLTKAITE